MLLSCRLQLVVASQCVGSIDLGGKHDMIESNLMPLRPKVREPS